MGIINEPKREITKKVGTETISIPLITNLQCAILFIDSLKLDEKWQYKSWEEY